MSKPYREYTPEDIYNMRFEITTLRKQLDQLKAELEAYKMESDEGKEINAELKAENEQLKNFHINLVGVKECEIRELARYKQAIEKIKDIAQDFGFNGIYEDCFTGIQKILQICDEVLSE